MPEIDTKRIERMMENLNARGELVLDQLDRRHQRGVRGLPRVGDPSFLSRSALALVVGLFVGAASIAGIADAPALAAEPAPTVTDISVAPYEASNPLVPSAALPFLAVTLTV